MMNNLASVPLPSVSTAWVGRSTPSLTGGVNAAREFESYLVESLLGSLEKTFATVPGDPRMPGQDEYNSIGQKALASAVTDAGGFGIAKMLSEHLMAARK
ncbi:MAG TPA: hypothetical protein VI386_33280 [Candidatus Sulfotelmatobacter sp.]